VPSTADRPKTWNDDIRWLLARLLGIPSGGGEIPVGAPTSFVLERVQGSVLGQDSASEVAITLPTYTKFWWLVAVRFYRTSGTAANMQFTMGEIAGYTSGSIQERVSVRQRAVSKPIDDVLLGSPGAGLPLQTDGSSQLHFRPGWNAGADNAADYDFWFVQAIEAQ